jgi:hypothetical protein
MPATYEPIATVTVGTATSTITISSIPATYTDLVLVGAVTVSPDPATVIFRFNNDTSSLYSQTLVAGAAYGTASERESNQGRINIGATAGATTSPNAFIASINNYSNTNVNKTILSRWSVAGGSNTTAQALVGLYRSTSAINRIDIIAFSANFTTGATLTLYGIKAA